MKTFKAKCKLILVLFLASLIISCSDKFENEDQISNLTISSVRILEDQDEVELLSNLHDQNEKLHAKMASNSVTLPDSEPNDKPKYIIHENTDFDYTVNLSATAVDLDEKEKLASQAGVKSKLKKSSSLLAANDVVFAPAKKFRLVIYPSGHTTNPIYNEVLQVNVKPNIKMSVGSNYDWYAFTIGDTESVPNIDMYGKISKSDIANKDFMLAKGSLTISSGENFLEIVFKRQTARIQVLLNTRGVFGPMQNSTTVSAGESVGGMYASLIKAGDFNIMTGQYTNVSDYDMGTSAANAIDQNANWPNEEKLFTLYTALNADKNIAAGTLQVKLKAISITLDDNTIRTFTSNSIVPLSSVAALTLAKGNSYKIQVQLVESPVIVNGVKWARTNLVYDANKMFDLYYLPRKNNGYRFRPNNNYSVGTADEYWNFSTITPQGTDVNMLLLCHHVYPEGTWTDGRNSDGLQHFTKLSAINNTYEVHKLSDNSYRHSLVWPGEGQPNPAYSENNLRFNMVGRRVNGTIVDIPSSSENAAGGLYLHTASHQTNAGTPAEDWVVDIIKVEKQQNSNPGTLQEVNGKFALQGYNVRCVRRQGE